MPPREINPRISAHTEHAIVSAIAQHPDDRPPTIEAFRDLLFSEPLPDAATSSPARRPSLSDTKGLWQELLAEHAALVATVVLLTATALLVTLLSPRLP